MKRNFDGSVEFGTSDAVLSLKPGAIWTLRGDVLTWESKDITQPTDSEIKAEVTRLQTEWENNKYQRDRKVKYPDLADFADAMYWNSKGDDTNLKAYYAACEKVKSDNPKP